MSIKSLTRLDLGVFPTPCHYLPNLTAALNGPQIWIKRDDLTGLALGGNKTRKLAFILQQALEQGCDSVITAGAAQSNHCRQTAAAAAQLGLACHLVLGGQAPTSANGNLLLDQLLGAHIHWAGENRKGEDIPALAETLRQRGQKPYVVPYGGSNVYGAYSFVQALQELNKQTDLASFSHILFASSSGGTHAGLLLGKALLKLELKLVGINIDKGETDKVPFPQAVLDLANQTSEFVGANIQFKSEDVSLDDNYIGDGYGVVGEREQEAIYLVAQQEGILLDPVYTGRAMAALIDMIRTKQLSKDDKVLFWHTGGAPALFAYVDKLQG